MTRNRDDSHQSRDMHLPLQDAVGSYQNHNITIKHILKNLLRRLKFYLLRILLSIFSPYTFDFYYKVMWK